jgi:hypothetical protein
MWLHWRSWPRREAGLKPYWGKPTVRNFRGGGGDEVQGLTAVCHDARKGRYIGSRWPKHARASAPLGGSPSVVHGPSSTFDLTICNHPFNRLQRDPLTCASSLGFILGYLVGIVIEGTPLRFGHWPASRGVVAAPESARELAQSKTCRCAGERSRIAQHYPSPQPTPVRPSVIPVGGTPLRVGHRPARRAGVTAPESARGLAQSKTCRSRGAGGKTRSILVGSYERREPLWCWLLQLGGATFPPGCHMADRRSQIVVVENQDARPL